MGHFGRLSARARTLWLVLLVLLLAAGLRLWRIDRLPPGFHFDESFEGLEAWRILTEPAYRPIFLAGNFGVPPLNAYANAVTFVLFEAFGGEAGPTAMRITAAVFGLLGVLAVYALAVELRRLDGPTGALSPVFALFAAGLLATLRWHIHFSRMGIEPVIVPLLWAAALWLLLIGRRSGRLPAYAGCGVVLAACMYTYQGAWIIPLLMVPSALLLFPARRGGLSGSKSLSISAMNDRHVRGLLLAAFVAALLFAPLALHFRSHPELLLMRPAQIAVVGETGSPADASLGATVWATAKMFGPLGRPGDLDPRRNLPGAPALNLWQALPFYLGLGLALWRVRRTAYALLLIGLVGLLLPGVFSEYAPHFHRILGAAAPAALLAAVGLDAIWSSAPLRRRRLHWAAVVLLALGAAAGARDYFVRWAALPDLFYAFDVGLWETGRWIAEQPPERAIYVTPRGAEHATLAFAWRERSAAPISFDGRHLFPLTAAVSAQPQHYVTIEHEDFRTRLLLPEIFPDAGIDYVVTDAAGQVYAQVYTRPAGSEAQRPPQVPLSVPLGDGIALAGYDLQPEAPRAGEPLYLQLHWLTDAVPTADWTVFTHLVDRETGAVVAGYDSRPGAGSLPTTRWQPGWRILDEYQIALPADLPPGRYDLRAGFYRSDGARLPDAEGGIELGEVTVQAGGK